MSNPSVILVSKTDTKDPCFLAFPASPPTSHSSLHETQPHPLDLHDG